ncbi:MAG TPA: hypothetical protein VJ715_19670 [Pyrinomonadaceae bacterium]|nr:hypothetical protein [Pyrinomonadaceae bacterium]
MKRLLSSRLALVTPLAVLIVTVALVWGTHGRPPGAARVRVENKTSSLAVVSVKNLGKAETQSLSQFAVTVKNNSGKPVIAYSIRVEDGLTDKAAISAVERGGLIDDWSLAPNATDVVQVSAASAGEVVLTLYAVMFEDGRGEGDRNDLRRLHEVRAGVKLAYQRMAPILRRAAKENGTATPDAAVQALEKELASVSETAVPMNFRRGFAQARRFVGVELDEVKGSLRRDPSLKHGAEINRKLGTIEKALARL